MIDQFHLINRMSQHHHSIMTVAPTFKPEDVATRECRFIVHIPTTDSNTPDLHMVKEIVTLKSGVSFPNLRYIKDFKRPVWYTKPNKRNHKEKKEYEHLDNLLRVDVRQSDLRNTVAKILDKAWSREGLRELCASPYIYGTDISSSTLIKKYYYKDKYPNVVTPFTNCTFDVETDLKYGTNQILMASAAFKDKILVAIDKKFIQGYQTPVEFFNKACAKHLSKYIKDHNLKIMFKIVDSEIDVVRTVFNQIHEWKPDWLSIWNIDFDIPKVLEACKRANVDPKDILCDPTIPPEFRICKYKRGQVKKVTASGQVKPVNPANQWHTLLCTSSFYVIDAMSVMRYLRLQDQERQSYKLDDVLKDVIGVGKINIPEAAGYEKEKWHSFMQTNYIFDYCAYNAFDSYSMLLLDDKLKDLQMTLPDYADCTDFWDYKSQPKRLRDSFFFFALHKHNHVLGTVGPNNPVVETKSDLQLMFEAEAIEGEDESEGTSDVEEESETLSRSGWVN